MRKIFIIASFVLMASDVMAQKTKMSINVKQPGTLAECIGKDNKFTVKRLTIKGRLNADDVIFLREMAGRDTLHQEVKNGKLESLNLLNASFVAGERPFAKGEKSVSRITTDGGDLPDMIFNACHLKELVFPKGIRKIGAQALYRNKLKSVILPEYVELGRSAFAQNFDLQEVQFPKTVEMWNIAAFAECNSLKEMNVNNVVFLHNNAFYKMQSLEQVIFRGWILHMNGFLFYDCPKVKNTDFYGEVYSTGGIILAEKCPLLEQLVFHAPVFTIHLGEVEECPSFKGISATSLVVSSSEKHMLPESPIELVAADYTTLMNTFSQRMDQLRKDGMMLSYLATPEKKARQSLLEATYNQACKLALANKHQQSIDLLEHLVADGFNEYYHMKQDKDLDSLRSDLRFQTMMASLEKTESKINILKASPEYVHRNPSSFGITFTYQEPTDSMLTSIRQYFNLDSIAGNGDEITRIKNIMYWLHDAIRHDGNSSWPNCKYNAIELYELTKREKRGLNCRFMSMVLNDLYLAAGFKSRFLTCQSRDYDMDNDCHVINIVWSNSLGKWIWMDASFAAYVTDENGLLLHPGEVRERLRKDMPLVLNEDANWNHKNKETKDYYLDYYMAKNLYLLSAHLKSETESESNRMSKTEITLIPKGFNYAPKTLTTEDDQEFWQRPQ
jgi:hypothetical protein